MTKICTKWDFYDIIYQFFFLQNRNSVSKWPHLDSLLQFLVFKYVDANILG